MFKLKRLMVVSALALSGCVSLAPDYQRPERIIPQQFSLSHQQLVPISADYRDTGWSSFFIDSELQHTINTALSHNLDLKMAILKVEEAQAQYRLSNAARYPELSASSTENYQKSTKNGAIQREYQVGGTASFEIDLFGKLKNMSESEQLSYFASEEAQRNVHILLVSNVAQAYFKTQLTIKQIAIAKETLRNYQQSYQFIEQRVLIGRANILALEQAKGVIESTKSEIANLEGELSLANHTLQLLVGDYHVMPEINADDSQHLNPIKLPANLSSDILLQRPDIIEAEYQLRSANADIGVARAAFFPSITLTSGISGTSTDLVNLFSSSNGIWSFIPKIELPIFNAGKNEVNLNISIAKQKQAVVNYQQKIQSAFKDVSDALALRESIQHQIVAEQQYLTSLKITLQRAQALYANGAVSYIEVLDAERVLFITKQTILSLIYAQQVNEIKLFTSLGGGWAK